MRPKIAKVVVGLPVEGPFDYEIGEDLRDKISVGHRVRISFNRRERVGFVIGTAQRSAFKRLNPVVSLLDQSPALNEPALSLAKAIKDQYGCSLGEAIEACLPPSLRHHKTVTNVQPERSNPGKKGEPESRKMLIHDQTRHRRWALIEENICETVNQKKQVIILVPEIVFIDEIVFRLKNAFDCPIAVLNKKLTPKKEAVLWEEIRRGDYAIAVGPRSAVFAPFPDLGLIVIEDEGNEVYKQEQPPHYRANEVALMRSRIENCHVIMASVLPSAETWERARRDKWERADFQSDKRIDVQIVDMTNYTPGKSSILSFPLQNAIQKALEDGGKIILLMNRRGFSTRTSCQQCGFTIKCQRCNVNLSYLYSKKTMICRHCNFKTDLPKVCPQCNGSYLRSTGIGVEKLESDVARIYPAARTHRCDSVKKETLKEADIMIATQAVFRHHEQAAVSLAAVLNFDDQLHHHDFRCGHKALTLLVQMMQLTKGKLLIQTRMSENYCLKAAKSMDFAEFYRQELKQRKELDLPPYRYLVALSLRGRKEDDVLKQSNDLYNLLIKKEPKGIDISDPHPDTPPKLRDQYRYMILLKGRSVKVILALVKSALKTLKKRSITIALDVDP